MPSKAELKAVEQNIFGKNRVKKSVVGKADQCKEYVEKEFENYKAIKSTAYKLADLIDNGLSLGQDYGVPISVKYYRDLIETFDEFMDSANLFVARYLNDEELKGDIESQYRDAHEEI